MAKSTFQFRRLWTLTRPPLGKFLITLFLSLVNTGISLTIPLFMKQLLDSFSKGLPSDLIVKVILLAIPIMVFIVMPMGRKIYKVSREQQDQMSKLTAFLAQ